MKTIVKIIVEVELEGGAKYTPVTLADVRKMVDKPVGAVGMTVPVGSYVLGGHWEKEKPE